MNTKTRRITIGLITAPIIRVCFRSPYRLEDTTCKGEHTFSLDDLEEGDSLLFSPLSDSADFELQDVVIGIDFHWERKENQRFRGSLKIVRKDNLLEAINSISIEDYLLSVISSEMSATSSLEFLKAHAVISRSWLVAQKEKASALHSLEENYSSIHETEDEYIRWYDREDHDLFDVCADDHCQRYQGISRISSPSVEQAIRETSGEYLCYKGKVCDARFSKCCGGQTEAFENVWEPVRHPYLVSLKDADEQHPFPFCDTQDKSILSQVLNDYDRETADFFRWKVELTQEEISDLLRRKTLWDFGEILDLIPLERGASGRIIRLKIIGTKRTKIIGKELFIRKALSESHLYSSAFTVEKRNGDFILHGSGWGHGVGLCQIGAAVMGAKGYNYREILAHYFPNTTIEKI